VIQLSPNTGLKFAAIVSLFCHIFCFNSIEFTFDDKMSEKDSEFSRIFFLGSILNEYDHYSQDQHRETDYSKNRLNARGLTDMLAVKSSPIYELGSDFKKPPLANLIDNKIVYLQPYLTPETKRAESSIMFYPPMPYHFLLYFKDRQTAHMEVAFYISPKGRVLGLKRKISSGNPEVDLLIMRNLAHFLNLCKSNFALGFWQTVKIDLSP
jgi:hypothetical protein